MSEQEQTIAYRKMWLTPSLIILTRQGEEENILVSCKIEGSHTGSNSSEYDCNNYIDPDLVNCNSLTAS